MEKAHVKEELINNAERIQKALEGFAQNLRILELATCYLNENQAICRAIGVEEGEPYASRLEKVLQEATEYGRYISSALEMSSAEYVNAIKNCGIPMTPAFPDLWDRLTDKNL